MREVGILFGRVEATEILLGNSLGDDCPHVSLHVLEDASIGIEREEVEVDFARVEGGRSSLPTRQEGTGTIFDFRDKNVSRRDGLHSVDLGGDAIQGLGGLEAGGVVNTISNPILVVSGVDLVGVSVELKDERRKGDGDNALLLDGIAAVDFEVRHGDVGPSGIGGGGEGSDGVSKGADTGENVAGFLVGHVFESRGDVGKLRREGKETN